VKSFDSSVIPGGARRVCDRLEQHGHEAWLVGGCVRDTLLGRRPKDWDIATSARPEEVLAVFGAEAVIPTGIEHGTVTVKAWREEGATAAGFEPVEVTMFRGDGEYGDGRRPDSVRFVESIEADLARRDFTMNAMAFRPAVDSLSDPFLGKADLDARRIRAVGVAEERFNEDGLRVMRACRFAAQLGFTIEEKTAQAIPTAIGRFRMVAVERITSELEKLVTARHARLGLTAMFHSGLLNELFPAAFGRGAPPAVFDVIEALPSDLAVRLAGLFEKTPKCIERLRLPTATVREVQALIAALQTIPEVLDTDDGGVIRRWAAATGEKRYEPVLVLAKTLLPCRGEARRFARLVGEVMAGRPPLTIAALALTGQGVQEILGVPPGRAVGEALRWLLEQCFRDPTLNTPDGLRKALLERYGT
jgi:tRNA nucleotidyltransferase (CCA-adding enzyme)